MHTLKALDWHQSRRENGFGCTSLLVGSPEATYAALTAWAGSHGRRHVPLGDPLIEADIANYTAVLLDTIDLLGSLVDRLRPPRIPDATWTKESWLRLTAQERMIWFEQRIDDCFERRLSKPPLLDFCPPEVRTFDELGLLLRLVPDARPPALSLSPSSECRLIDDLSVILSWADSLPQIPLFVCLSDLQFEELEGAARRGDRIASFVRDGLIRPGEGIIERPDSSQSIQKPKQIPDSRFEAARRDDPFDSRAEAHLSSILEGDSLTAGLFTPQGQPGFLMANRQPARIDFLCPSLCIAIEVDGPHHLEPEQYRRDRRKDLELHRAGYTVLRFLAEDVTSAPEEIRRTIRSAVLWRRGDRV